MRRQVAHEDGLIAALGPLVSKVVLQRLAGDSRQRQDILTAALRSLERDRALAPVDVGQLQVVDLDAAQAEVERQSDDGQTAPRRRYGCGE